jgi:hypothetical protein
MRKAPAVFAFIVVVCVVGVWPRAARAQEGFQTVAGDAFTRAVPADFYLEGNRIPVEKRNAVLLKTGKGARVVIALIDTTGYSSQIQQKYIGMLITETNLSVCGNSIGVGSYGFGLERPAAASNADAHFQIYNQAGEKVGECSAPKDQNLKQPRPLAVVTSRQEAAELYLGRYAVEIK